jgi:tetratricopeptide (TPR) repeat protein
MSADWLRRGLTESGLADAAEPSSSSSGLNAIDAARAVRAGSLISGAIYRRGDSLEFDVRVSDVNNGQVVREAPPVSTLAAQPMAGVEALRQRVLAELGTIINPRFSEVARVTAHPPTFDAYREVVEGDGLAGRGDAEAALDHYRRAVALDSTFGGAVLRVATMLAILSRCDEVDSVSRAVSARGLTLGPYDRLQQRRQVAFCNHDYDATYAAAVEMTRLAPLSEDAWIRLSYSARYLDRCAEASRILDSLARRPGGLRDERAYLDLAICRHMLGQYDRELSLVEARNRSGSPRITEMSAGAVRALAALGRFRQLDSALKDLVGDRLDQGHLRFTMLAGDELYAHGHPREARQMWQRIVAGLTTAPDSTREASIGFLLVAMYNLGRYADVDTLQRRLDAQYGLRTPFDSMYSITNLGLLAARQGRRADADLAMAKLARIRGRSLGAQPTRWRAAIASVLQDREMAVRLLRQAFAEGMEAPRQELHADIEFSGLRGYAPFDSLMKPPG